MAQRKVTDDKLEIISRMDLEGETLQDIGKEIGVSKNTVKKHLDRIRIERRESRSVKAWHFLEQLDELKRQTWQMFKQNVIETRADKNGTTITTKGPPIHAARVVLDILREQARILGLGSTKIELSGDINLAPKVVNVVVKDRAELERAMSLGVFESAMLPAPPVEEE